MRRWIEPTLDAALNAIQDQVHQLLPSEFVAVHPATSTETNKTVYVIEILP